LVISYRLSVISYRLSVIGYRLSGIRYRVEGYQLPKKLLILWQKYFRQRLNHSAVTLQTGYQLSAVGYRFLE